MRPKWIAAAAAAMSLLNNQAGASYERPLKTLTLRRGDTLLELLQEQGVRHSEAAPAVQAFVPLLDLSALKPAQKVGVLLGAQDLQGFRELRSVAINPASDKEVVVVKEVSGVFRAKTRPRETTQAAAETRARTIRADFVVTSSIYENGLAAGVPEAALSEIVRLLSYHLDIQRQVHDGDRYEVLYEMKEAAAEKPGDKAEKNPRIISFSMTPANGEKVSVYRYEDENGKEGYYFGDGKSVERSMLQTPVDAKRISSGFGMRRHPISGYTKMHKGVDFAAPAGTPVYASGDGVVDFTGRMSGYGKIVRLKHDQGMETAYAHLSRFADGMAPGDHVSQGQIIGYVGSTGSATGPHLHYEVLKNDVQINPLSVAGLPSRQLSGLALAIFQNYKAQVGALYLSGETVPAITLASSQR